jgi:hypothetical protein
MSKNRLNFGLFVLILLVTESACVCADSNDLNIDGVFEAALDLPRIYFLLKRDPNGPPLEYMGSFELNYAFLDTGASGILMSRETAEYMGLAIEPEAQYVDAGVAGEEYFDVSELLYIGTANFNALDPYDPEIYTISGAWRFQINQNYADLFPLDILGMPVMAGKTVVLDPTGLNNLSNYFCADIKQADDLTIPAVDFKVVLRFEKYVFPEDPRNIPPLPVLAYNPVIDNIIVEYNGITSTGSWLFDTGGTISNMSVAQGVELGLTDEYGEPIVTPDFYIDIGGIGGQVTLPGFQIDNLIIPTLCGYNLVFNNARITVHDIGVYDPEIDEYIILDGVFGSNFLCASAKLESGGIVDLAAGAFNRIVIDTQNALLGFDVNDVYPLPACEDMGMPWAEGDLNRDYSIDLEDLRILADEWLNDCNWLNWNCRGADLKPDEVVNFGDLAELANEI